MGRRNPLKRLFGNNNIKSEIVGQFIFHFSINSLNFNRFTLFSKWRYPRIATQN